jgi:hypothetical protein
MENTLNKNSLAKATKLLEILYLPESKELIQLMDPHDSAALIDLLVQTGWSEERLSRHLDLLHQVEVVSVLYQNKGKSLYRLNHEKLIVVCRTARILSKNFYKQSVS